MFITSPGCCCDECASPCTELCADTVDVTISGVGAEDEETGCCDTFNDTIADIPFDGGIADACSCAYQTTTANICEHPDPVTNLSHGINRRIRVYFIDASATQVKVRVELALISPSPPTLTTVFLAVFEKIFTKPFDCCSLTDEDIPLVSWDTTDNPPVTWPVLGAVDILNCAEDSPTCSLTTNC